MRIKWLDLKAYGPFSDRRLDFSAARPGLHIVYGPNEAGKSSSLRALQALLFGFPVRSGDNFLHPYDQLLVGGCLQGEDGRELIFYRRKRAKNSLFDQNDKPLDPAVLTPFLRGLEPDLFSTFYGIDHDTLIRGGQGILERQGEVGQALFAAGAGLASLKGILEGLEKEGDELFRPKGSSQAISAALGDYRQLQERLREASLSGREWQEHQRALQEAADQLEQVNARRSRLTREKSQCERLQRALPSLGERRVLLRRLAEMGEQVELPSDFAGRRKSLEQRQQAIRLRLDTARNRRHDLEGKSAEITPNHALLDRAEAVEQLHQQFGQYQKGNRDRLTLDGRRAGLRAEAAELLKRIRPGASIDGIEPLRPHLIKRKTVQDLAGRYEALVQGLRRAERTLQTTAQNLNDSRQRLAELPPAADTAHLVPALVRAQKAGDPDAEIVSLRTALEQAWEQNRKGLERLGLWKGPLERVTDLPLPGPETVDRFEAEFRGHDEEQQQLQQERRRLEKELTRLTTQLHEIEYAAEIPSEQDLARHRSLRDQGWQLLRRQWLQGQDMEAQSRAYDPDHALPEAYELRVAAADQTADRLYREAERVQKHAALRAATEETGQRLQALQELEEKTGAGRSRTSEHWETLWSAAGIHPLPPREMRSWLSAFDRLRSQVEETARAALELELRESRRQELRSQLARELAGVGRPPALPGQELSPLVQAAETLVQEAQRATTKRDALDNRIRDMEESLKSAQNDRREAEEAWRQWQAQWEQALSPLGIAATALPAEAQEYLDTLQECFAKLREAEDLRKRIQGIERDAAAFEQQLRGLAAETAPDLAALDIPAVVAQLKGHLARAGQDQTLLQGHTKEIEALEKEIRAGQTEVEAVDRQLAELVALAGCDRIEQLDEAERRSAEYRNSRERLEETEQTLARSAEGISLDELEEQARGLDPDGLPGRIEALSREIEGLDPDILRLSEAMGREKSALERMDGSGRAAELADEAQQTLARIRRLTGRYIRLKLATRILREEIERYRAENQDPILAIASGCFSELTLGSFAGLRTDIDDQGQPVLIGVRPDGRWVPVAGMSSGTCDQLYLALRLATLQWRLRANEPMPFIVDDILINFDDQRSAATLKALDELAAKTQVILFTHHSQIPEMALALKGSGRIAVHRLA